MGNKFLSLLVAAIPGIGAWILIKLFIAGVVAIAFFFAPAGVALGGRQAWPSLKQSWEATAVNLASLTAYGLYFLGAVLLALAPAILCWLIAFVFGWGWLALAIPLTILTVIPLYIVATAVGVTAAYAAYCDVFSHSSNQAVAGED
jgi:hypothetical protein